MKMEFTSIYGSVVFSGGRFCGRDTCYIVEVSGIGLAARRFSTVTFSGTDGTSTTGKQYSSRTVIVSADIPRREYDFDSFYARFLRILSEDGELFVYSGKKKKRRIPAYVSGISEGKSNGDFKRVVISFYCDSPYFTDIAPVSVSLFTREKHLETEFVLPLVFSERINRAAVTNAGDIIAEPVITFSNGIDGVNGENGNLTIRNETTGQVMVLNYYPAPGESVTIDISERKIVSSNGSSLINFISDDTDLSDFHLEKGENILCVESNITNARANVECSFYNRYLEGVVYGY